MLFITTTLFTQKVINAGEVSREGGDNIFRAAQSIFWHTLFLSVYETPTSTWFHLFIGGQGMHGGPWKRRS